MPGEEHFPRRREDAHFVIRLGGGRRHKKSCLSEIRPGGEALHCLIQKALPINDDGEPISFGGYRREDVALNKSSTDHVDGFLRVICCRTVWFLANRTGVVHFRI